MSIDKKNIDKVIRMTEEQVVEFSHQTKGSGYLHVIATDQGWAIVGPYGLFEDNSKNAYFEDLGNIHSLIRSWGFHNFFQEGYPHVFEQRA